MSDEQKREELAIYYNKKAVMERRKYANKKVEVKRTSSAYEYDEQGNLVERRNEEVIRTITLPVYRDVMPDERIDMEQVRQDAIALANKEYDDARMALHKEYQKAEPSDFQIHLLNKEVEKADLRLQDARFPIRSIIKQSDVEIRKLDFSQPNEVRQHPYDIAILCEAPFHLQDQYVRIGQPGAKSFVSIAEAKKAIAGAVIVFDNVNPDGEGYGFLSLNWPVEIEVEGTMYHSARQAIFGELAKSFGDEAHRQAIMIAENPEDIHYTVNDVPGDVEENTQKWDATLRDLIETVNLHKFMQYPELGGRLLDTHDAKLGAYEPDDNLLGTGVPLTHPRAKNPIYWTGQNLQGNALMLIRDILRQQREEEREKVVEAPKKSVKRSIKKSSAAPAPASVAQVAPVSVAQVAPEPVAQVNAPSIRRPRRIVPIEQNNEINLR
jgi:ribA/ribD-fused uncharacterized protein